MNARERVKEAWRVVGGYMRYLTEAGRYSDDVDIIEQAINEWLHHYDVISFGATAKTETAETPQTWAVQQVLTERSRQDDKWGERSHRDEVWLAILTEEVGEAAKAILQQDDPNLEEEVTQCAAVCLAWLECMAKRRSGKWPYLPPKSKR